MAEKAVKAKQPVKTKKDVAAKAPVKSQQQPEKPRVAQTRAPEKDKKDDKPQSKPVGRIARWWRETVGELRKVTWPTIPEARRLTYIVLIVVAATSLLLGLLDFIFSRLIGLLVAI